MCPLLFDSFTVSPPNALCKVERVICLARGAMAWKMEFGDKVRELEEIDVKVRVVLGETLKVMDGPFASDVVRNNNIGNDHVFQHRCNDIICVDVSEQQLESLR